MGRKRWIRRQWRGLCRWAVSSSAWSRFAFQGVFNVAVPGLLSENLGFREAVQKAVPSPLQSLVPFFLIGALFIWAATWRWVSSKMRLEAARGKLNGEDLEVLRSLIKDIVLFKSARFGQFVRNNAVQILQRQQAAQNHLRQITRPEDQIFFIGDKIRLAFQLGLKRRGGPEVQPRVRIFEMDDSGRPKRCVAWAPDAPGTNIEELQEHSLINYCHARRGVVVIEDIEAELASATPRFARTNSGPDVGSILAYPVRYGYTNTVPFVITVAADEPDSLLEEDTPLYKWIVDEFAERIVLEHSLYLIREATV